MRVTNKMISDQVIRNLDRALNRFMRLQARMSTGKRIQTPSDDPIGTQKDLKYRQILSQVDQFRVNIGKAHNLLGTYDNVVGEMHGLIQEAYTIAVAMTNESNSADARKAAGNQVEQIFDQMIALGNSQLSGRYIFSGFRTNTRSFEATRAGVHYAGDNGNMLAEIESDTKVTMNLLGNNVVLKQLSILGEEADLHNGIDTTTLVEDLNLGSGVDYTLGSLPGQFIVTDNNLGISVTVDLNQPAPVDGNTTIADILFRIASQLAAGGITNLAADIGTAGNNLSWVTSYTGEVSVNTPLENLNSGGGVNLTAGGLRVHNADYSIDIIIDISSASTLGDVISTFNSSLASAGITNVTASINAAGTGLEITDSNAVPLGLIIDAGQASDDLGISGNINPVLVGADLNPRLDFSVMEAAPDQTTVTDLGLLGDFSDSFEGQNLRPIIKTTTALSQLENRHGLELGQIKITQGNQEVIIDLNNAAYNTIGDLIDAINNSGLDIVASINADQTGLQIENNSTTESMKIEEIGDGLTAHKMGIFGSSDIMGSLMILAEALNNDNTDVISEMIGNMEQAMQSLLSVRGNVGARINRLETTDRRLMDLNYNFTDLLSEVEDADLTKLVTDLAREENTYQAALIASSKIIQPTLLDFLR